MDTSIAGTYFVTYNATDSNGNTGYASREVDVQADITPPTITSENIEVTINNDINGNAKGNPEDELKVTWDNSATGDDNSDVASATVDFSAVGNVIDDSAIPMNDAGTGCDNSADDGIWSACYDIDPGDVNGEDLAFTVTAKDNYNNAASAASGNTVFIDNQLPTLVSAVTQDTDGNGLLDALELTFDENIDDSLLEAGWDGWSVEGYTGGSIGTGDVANDTILLLSVTEDGLASSTPAYAYLNSGDGASTHDSAGNELQSLEGISSDGVAPVITLNGDNPTTLTVGDTYSEEGASATDDTDGDLSEFIAISGEVDTSVAGTYLVTYTVSDDAGNEATKTRTVTVNAAPAPSGGGGGGGGGGGSSTPPPTVTPTPPAPLIFPDVPEEEPAPEAPAADTTDTSLEGPTGDAVADVGSNEITGNVAGESNSSWYWWLIALGVFLLSLYGYLRYRNSQQP